MSLLLIRVVVITSSPKDKSSRKGEGIMSNLS